MNNIDHPQHYNIENKFMTKGELCKWLENCLKEYIAEDVKKSLIRNNYMTGYKNEKISKDTINAILIDFVNFLAIKQGVDYGLHVHHLKE